MLDVTALVVEVELLGRDDAVVATERSRRREAACMGNVAPWQDGLQGRWRCCGAAAAVWREAWFVPSYRIASAKAANR